MSKSLIHVISKGEVGGAQTSLLNYVKALSEQFEQTVFIGGKSFFLAASLDKINVSNRQVDFASVIGIARFSVVLRSRRAEAIVVTHSFLASAITRLLLLGTGTKIVYIVHGFVGNPSVKFFKRLIGLTLEKILKHGVSKYIAISNYEKSLIEDSLKTNAYVIPNTTENRATERVVCKKKVIVCLSRFAPPKLNELIVKSFLSSNLKNDTNYVLRFYGAGPGLKLCKSLIDKTVINVEFYEPLNEVTSVLESASTVILMSNHEGLPMTLLEALASDIPIICSEIIELRAEFQESDRLNIFFCKNDVDELSAVFNKYGTWINSLEKGINEGYFYEKYDPFKIRRLIQHAITD